MKKIKNVFIKKPALIYFVLTILITWGSILSVIGLDGITGAEEIPDAQMPILYGATLLGPCVAGLLMTAIVDGKKGFRVLLSRLGRWRVPLYWYAIALLAAPILITFVLLTLTSVSPNFLPALLAPGSNAGLIFIGIFMGLAVGFFEELGWTGFAVPRLLQKYSRFATGLITGIVWGLWHMPLFIGSMQLSGDVPPGLYLFTLLFSFLPAYRVLMVWVYDRSESLLLTILMHAPLSASQLILIPADLSGKQLVAYNMIFTGVLWLIIGIKEIVSNRTFQVQKKSV